MPEQTVWFLKERQSSDAKPLPFGSLAVYLLDTNVISELRKPKPHGAVLEWLQTVEESQLFLSAATLGEIQAGIEITRVQDIKKAKEIEIWLEQLIDSFGILPMDGKAFRIWTQMMHGRSNTISEDLINQLMYLALIGLLA